MSTLTIAAWQAAGYLDDREANLQAINDAAARATARGAELLVTPEMYLSGYNIPYERLLRQSTTDSVAEIAEIASAHGIAILAGVPEFTDDGVFNTSLLVTPEGQRLMQHRKYQLFGELDRGLFLAGDHPVTTCIYRGVRLGTMICYDVEFPETVRAAALAGVEVLLVPTAQMEGFEHVNDVVISARAWDNGLYLAYINRIGREEDLTYIGRSVMCDPKGRRVAEAAPGQVEDLLVYTVDTRIVAAARTTNPYLTDLRRIYEASPSLSAP
ncbi:putative amidohydrolase [Arthrobacter sp. CAN_A214]|uniref:carbon-nitrogen hydrolase family protein n=1 Tax=Arthrobacter sp. CAN_A214 TaxID=2787720 RepID=UPI0018C97AB1